MPELPEAETIARELNDALAGESVDRVIVARKDVIHGDRRPLGKLLAGRRIERVTRRAKRVILEFGPDRKLVFHLGMSGRLTLHERDDPIEKHTHLRISYLAGSRELRFRDPRRFGGVWCLTNGGKPSGRLLGELGPEPLELRLAAFKRLLARKRQIKALLLDQRAIAGLGNIYCDESLHAAGVHPLTKAHTLDDDTSRRLLRAIKSTLRRAIRFKGTTLMDYRATNGEPGSFQQHHRVYQREGQPCRTCGVKIVRILAAGRSTFYCPRCQPG